jgi:hypothetical protein
MVQLKREPAAETVLPQSAAAPVAGDRLPRDSATAPAAREAAAFPEAPGRPAFQSFLTPLAHGTGRSGQW